MICRREFIPPIPDSMIPMDLCKKNNINFTTDDMTSNFEFFFKKMDALYLTKSMKTN